MQRTIYLLSDETINQIAAGEVIESPASVVKELIENALDARATKISVEIMGGGLKCIRISDDGVGMQREDAFLSIVRHATSKITHPQDLFRISTKGFRGEALASIASISKMTLITAMEGQSGVQLEIEKAEVIKDKPCARTHGTTVEVRSLFYNVPARRRFQKTAAAIAAEVFRIVTVMALSHPEVQFTLISNGRKAIKTSSNNELSIRAKELLGEEFIGGSFPLKFEEGPLIFSGIIGSPTNTRNNKTGQFIFLNRRAINSLPISEAVRAGYGTRIDEKRHPIFLLHLDVPSDLVDVNVHPQKLQVRLREEGLFRKKIQEAIERALAKKIKQIPIEYSQGSSFDRIEIEAQIPQFQENPLDEQELLFDEHDEEASLEVMGFVNHFCFILDKGAFFIVDLKAARFRVIFENLLSNEDTVVEKQGLLVPFGIEINSIEAAMVLTHLNAIEALGFELKPIANGSFMVEAIPPFISESDVKLVITEMACQLQELIGKQNHLEERKKKLATCIARYAKMKKQYSKEEAKRLFEQLRTCKSPLHCPKGKPTMVHLDDDAIESFFRSNQKTPKNSSK